MPGIVAVALTDPAADPSTVQPSPYSSVVFLVLALATAALLLSMIRHLRRARANLPSGRSPDIRD